MSWLSNTAAAGTLAVLFAGGSGFAYAQQDADTDLNTSNGTVDAATQAELDKGCTFYTNILLAMDEEHFTRDNIGVTQEEMAAGAYQGVLNSALLKAPKTEDGDLDLSVVEFADPEKKDKVVSLTLDGTTFTMEDPEAPLRTYTEHCAYLDRLIVPLSHITDTEILELYKTAGDSAIQASRDPHSSYLNEKQSDEMMIQMKGEFGGLGIEVTMENGYVKVVSPIDDTPAAAADIQSGDLIVRIDKENVLGMSLSDAVNRMRGPVGTGITVEIKRGDGEPFPVTLERAIIVMNPIESKLLLEEDKEPVAYVRMKTFNEQTTPKLAEGIEALIAEAMEKGIEINNLVIDGRNNPGGLLEHAQMSSDLFMTGNKEIMDQIKDIEERQKAVILSILPEELQPGVPTMRLVWYPEQFPGAPPDILDRLTMRHINQPGVREAVETFKELEAQRDELIAQLRPIVATGRSHEENVTYEETFMDENVQVDNMTVLVNGGSASAMEILACALQDAGIAKVVGVTPTFGKGSVQTIVPVNDRGEITRRNSTGRLRVTTSLFFCGDKHLSNQASGVIQDIDVVNGDERDEIKARRRTEGDLDRALISAEKTRADMKPKQTCTSKYPGRLGDEQVAEIPEWLIIEGTDRDAITDEMGITHDLTTYWLDTALACSVHEMTGDDRFTALGPYVEPETETEAEPVNEESPPQETRQPAP